MALILGDRIKETTTVAGTGTATLLGATTGFQSFAAVGNGNTTYYCIADQGGPNWEVGIGTYSSSGTTLARTTVLASSNAGALVVFTTGVKDVFVTYPSEKGVWYDASGNVLFTGTTTATNLAYTGTLTGDTGILNIGSGQLYKAASGNVGIGTSTPGMTLEIESQTPATNTINVVNVLGLTRPVTSGVKFGNAANFTLGSFGTAIQSQSRLGINLADGNSSTPNTEIMTLLSSGNVGIGTSSPASKLHVYGGAGTSIAIQSSAGNQWRIGDAVGAANGTLVTYDYTNSQHVWDYASGAAGYHTLYTAGTPRMTIDSSGNVGIGVVPNVWSVGKAIEIGSAGNSILGAAAGNFQLYSNLYYNGGSKFATAAERFGSSFQMVNDSTYSYFAFNTTSVAGTAGNTATVLERMRIDSSGNVGIGTSSPASYGSPLTVYLAANPTLTIASGNANAYLRLNTTSDSNMYLTNTGGSMTMRTANTERARINASGQFLIGTSSNYFGENLTVYNNNASTAPVAFFYNPNPSTTGSALNIQTEGASGTTWKLIDGRSAGGAGRFFVFGNGNVQNSNNSYGAISDESVKESIVDATHKLDDLCKVKIRNFNLKNDENKIKQIGVVAQELEQIFPAMVEEVDGLKGVKYSIFVPILVKAIQELKAIIDTQQEQINSLLGK